MDGMAQASYTIKTFNCNHYIPESVRFKDGTIVAVKDLDPIKHADKSVDKVIWNCGSESWGKSWFGEFNGDCYPLIKIGAGAYGQSTIWMAEVS